MLYASVRRSAVGQFFAENIAIFRFAAIAGWAGKSMQNNCSTERFCCLLFFFLSFFSPCYECGSPGCRDFVGNFLTNSAAPLHLPVAAYRVGLLFCFLGPTCRMHRTCRRSTLFLRLVFFSGWFGLFARPLGPLLADPHFAPRISASRLCLYHRIHYSVYRTHHVLL